MSRIYIYMNNQIDIIDKSIQFKYIYPFEMCTLNAQMTSRHFNIVNSIVSFNQFKFINGKMSGSAEYYAGGSLYINDASTVDIFNCNFFTNEAYYGGGAIYIRDSISKMINITMSDNKCGFIGGAIALYNSNITMINNVMSNNVAGNAGGAVYSDTSDLNISNSILTENTATRLYGGAIESFYSTFVVTDTIITSNTAGEYGGAISSFGSTVIVTKSNLSDNTATINGTCLWSGRDNITITDSVAYNNNPKGLCEVTIQEIYMEANSRIEIAGKILLESQYCHDFPNPTQSPTTAKPSLMPKRKPSTMPSIKPIISKKTPTRAPVFPPFAIPAPTDFPTCVGTEKGLRYAVNVANARLSSTPTIINICANYIYMDSQIDINNKNIQFNCYIISNPSEMCTLNVQMISRHFLIQNSIISFNRFIFMNGKMIGDNEYDSVVGALFINDTSTVDIINCNFFTNEAFYLGGAIFIYNSISQMINITMRDNKCGYYGGAIALVSSNVTMINNSMSNNVAGAEGGAVYSYYGIVIISNSILTKNTATDFGGAIGSWSSNVVVTNTSITSNTADKYGGAILSYNNTLIVTKSTLSDNTATTGNGTCLASGGYDNITITDSVAYNNNPKSLCEIYTEGYSRIEISGNILLRSQACHVFPNPKPSPITVKPSLMPKRKPSIMPSIKPRISKNPPSRAPVSPPVTIPVPTQPSRAPISPPVTIPVRTESPTTMKPIPSPSCLSGDNLVYVKNIGYKRLDELKIGEYIESSNGDFTQIYGFGHMDPYQESEFLQLHYQSDNIPVFSYLEVSPKHIVNMNQNNQTNMIRASDVVIGDKLSGMIVKNIQIVVRQGLYAPLTYSGDFMVNGVIVSNYVDVLDHDWIWSQHTIGHILFLPQRVFCGYFMEICKQEMYIDGYGYLAYIIIRGSSFVQPSLLIVNNMILIVTIGFVFAVICYLSHRLWLFLKQ